MKDHTIVCGYGSKGRSAVKTLCAKGTKPSDITVIEPDGSAREAAKAAGLAVVAGQATLTDTLRSAGIEHARTVIIAVARDDTAVLATLTAREHNRTATIVASVREEENVHLLHQSGADAVITSSSAAGRLLGLSAETPQVTEVLEDLLTVGAGLDLSERSIGPDEAGPVPQRSHEAVLLGVVRDGEVLRFDDERAAVLREGDRVIELFSHRH